MRWRILKMSRSTSVSPAFAPLQEVAELVSVPPDRDPVLKVIPECDAVWASFNLVLDRTILEKATRLRAIATAATGTDHIDVKYAEEHGIAVLGLKDEREFLNNVTATAEMSWALMLSVIRRLPWAFESAKAGIWRTSNKYCGRQLSGKTLGVLGYGRLGHIVSQYGKGFRMRVLACDVREVKPDESVTIVDLDTLLRESDVLSIHIHLTDENRGFIGKSAFDKMKRGAVLVNTSRGAIIDEAAFIEALESGKLAGAGVDVITNEWNTDLKNHPLIRYANTHENLVITPHIAGATVESQAMTTEFMVRKLRRFLDTLT